MGKKRKREEAVRRPEAEPSRKEARREQRQMKKQARQRFFEGRLCRRRGKPVVESPGRGPGERQAEGKARRRDTEQAERKAHGKLLADMKKQRKRQLLDANLAEDKEIRFLEKRLKLANKKAVASSKGFVESGLDYILDVCDSEKIPSALGSEVNFQASDSDFEEDLALVQEDQGKPDRPSGKALSLSKVGKAGAKISEGRKRPASADPNPSPSGGEYLSEDEDSLGGSSGEDNPLGGSSEEDNPLGGSSEEDNPLGGSSEEDNPLGGSSEEDDSAGGSSHSENEAESTGSEVPETWEDIYGRIRDRKGNVLKETSSKYIPPHLRQSNDTVEDVKRKELKRQLKGLLNRLALNNIHSIANQVEDLYSKNSRHSMNESIFELYVDSLVTPVLSPERLIIDHAMLIAVLHANVGSEIGAYMLQNLVQKFDSQFLLGQIVENKVLDNLLFMISYLYNFKLFEAALMYDILNRLSSDMTEKNIDLILIILKSVGFQLRKDNPMSMKAFLLNVQKQMNLATEVEDRSRMKYMLEILLSIKNNNISKLSDFDPEQQEHLKKVLKSVIRSGNSIVALRIGLEDLLKAEERGRWWIVGSAWNKEGEDTEKTRKEVLPREEFSAQLIALARKQRMNTDNRRNIFCILMSAEDYHDAFEKILKLGLKGQQEREIPHVIIHCLLQEKSFNAYYAYIADQLCISDRRHQMALQCALWDRFRALEKLSSSQINILAKFVSQVVLAGSVPISVLKVVEFAELDKRHIRLLRQTLLSLANVEGKDSLAQVFLKVSKSKKLALFRESLRLFIHHFILRNLPDGEIKNRITFVNSVLIGEID